MTDRTLEDAVLNLKSAMAIIAHEFMHGNNAAFEDELNSVYALLDRAKYDLHDIIDKVSISQRT